MTTERMSAERLAEIRHYVDGGMIGYPEFVAELLRELDAVREERDRALADANRADMRADELAHQLARMTVDSGLVGPQIDPDELRFLND